MLHQVSDEAISSTSKCTSNYACLNDSEWKLCRGNYHIKTVGIYTLESFGSHICRYNDYFGYFIICKCPIRIELFNKHRI